MLVASFVIIQNLKFNFNSHEQLAILLAVLSNRVIQHDATAGSTCRNGFQIGRAPANILNRPPRTADEGWSSSLGLGRGVKDFPPLKLAMLPNISQGEAERLTFSGRKEMWIQDFGEEN